MLNARERAVLEALEPHAASVGMEIVTVSIVGGSKAPTLRVYIDTPEGVGLEDLTKAQAWIGEIVDELDPFPGSYSLEVSSPGIDRPLRTPEHFKRFIGERAQIKTANAIDARKSFTGVLTDVTDDVVTIDDGAPHSLPFETITGAHLIGTVDFSS